MLRKRVAGSYGKFSVSGDHMSKRKRREVSRRIVVVGGGFAGFWAAVAARRVAPAKVDVVMVSREATMQMRPRLYEANPGELTD